MGATMRAVDIKGGKGPASALFINEIPHPQPKASDAIVRVKAFGLNRMDLIQREGNYPLPPQAPTTLGVEFSGVIEELGTNPESGFKVGDEVFGLAYGGAYAEYIAISTHMLIHKPKEMSWELCAGIPETWITALQALHLVADLKPGQTILWHAGASSVSIAGIQLSKIAEASAVFATTRSDAKCEFVVKEIGANKAFNSGGDSNWADQVLEETGGKGVDVIIDFVGASYFADNLKALAKDGRMVMLGLMGGLEVPAGTNLGPILFKRLRVEGSTLRSRDENYQKKLRDDLASFALPKFLDGTLKVPIEKVFPWTEIIAAHQLLEGNSTMGKVICRID
ncbi:NAD(P)-binding protein [Eremomyces bilateralis CBS 781.70]|uniref:NAD(P)-binding protein n=1 Tax=Eremomyces bilateralis CBS 781.70 TaxID=1392243 RepID=A0A6G1FTB9_9PEZI|nr:NAD(P)-binding protein [Eremomyces bilateralis CBS 781.70]KAF1809037.1 NAD(P)-binding protein [Eremomyces bilateralis CBS 781.70]